MYDPQRTSIRDHHGISRGEIYVLREITVQKRREETLRALQSATQRFMDAEHREEIAEIAVETADEVLDHPHSLVVFPEDDGTVLRSAALTDSIARRIRGDMVFPRKPGPMWEVFDSGEPGIHESISELTDVRYAKLPIGCLLLVPLGEHGVLGVGSDEEKRAFDADNRRFANILATTTETALDRAQREAELRMSQRTVEERTEQIEFFNGVLRHDILNGMTVINGNLELLGDHVDEEGQPLLETVQSWSEDIGQLTQKVRSVSQTVTDSESVMLTNRSLSKTLAKKTKKIQHTYPDINLQTDIEDGLRVSANELLGEVLENVLLNAIEHNDRDVPSLAVRACHSDGEVRVEIEDDGPGIPDEMKSQMFDQHVTSETSGSIGFGLYFVHVMMEQFGGNVWFEDTDTRGVVAILTFPTATPDIKNG
ncbi:sensor histidine kinase [Haladaptatus sp. NG-SE-30]